MHEDSDSPPPLPTDEDIARRFERIRQELELNHSAGDELELDLHAAAMEEQVRKATADALPSAPTDEIDAKLNQLKQRAASARRKHEKDFSLDEKAVASSSKNARASGLGLMVAYMILGFPMSFAAIGWLIDRSTGAKAWTGIMTVIGACLGVAVTVAMVNRHSKEL